MAKDPAMLWYWADWHSGTTTLSRFLKGCYMDILHAQFNSGRLTMEEIRTVLGSDFGQAWPTLQKKFTVDDTGKYFNVRLEEEKDKRAAFTASRRKNLKSIHTTTHMETHMQGHMENENENASIVFDYKKESNKKTFDLPVTIPESTSDDQLYDAECWTEAVIAGNDVVFMEMLRRKSLNLNGRLESITREHLELTAKYSWHKKWDGVQQFRYSLLKHASDSVTKKLQNHTSETVEERKRKFEGRL